MAKLSAKKEKFALLMATGAPQTGKPLTQSEAYRLAFKPKKMKEKTVWEEASRVAADPKVSARIQELMKPVVESVQMSKSEWMRGLEKLSKAIFTADTRKLYDPQGSLVDVREIGDAEELLIRGIEVEENFVKVGDKAEHVGYTKKVKLDSRIGTGFKSLIEFGKVMGWYSEEKEDPPRGMVIIIQRDSPPEQKTIDVTPKTIQPTGQARAKLPARIERA